VRILPWLDPVGSPNLASYAKVYVQQDLLADTDLIVGFSYGGMLATEISTLTQIPYLLISIAQHPKQFNPLLRLLRPMARWVPKFLLNQSNFVIEAFFGCTTPQAKSLLRETLKATDPILAQQFLLHLAQWQGTDTQPMLQIHGQKDRLIRPHPSCTFLIEGGHFAVFEQGKQISQILAQQFNPYPL
jgi:pimeloyl-ACP methyl ester carboxylesterase